jgi:hypothetical protein
VCLEAFPTQEGTQVPEVLDSIHPAYKHHREEKDFPLLLQFPKTLEGLWLGKHGSQNPACALTTHPCQATTVMNGPRLADWSRQNIDTDTISDVSLVFSQCWGLTPESHTCEQVLYHWAVSPVPGLRYYSKKKGRSDARQTKATNTHCAIF